MSWSSKNAPSCYLEDTTFEPRMGHHQSCDFRILCFCCLYITYTNDCRVTALKWLTAKSVKFGAIMTRRSINGSLTNIRQSFQKVLDVQILYRFLQVKPCF